MDDLISRNAALQAVGALTWAGARISNLPSAEPKRPKGKWVELGAWGGIVVCSECKMLAPEEMRGCLANRHLEQIRTSFCPHCGAEMEEAE